MPTLRTSPALDGGIRYSIDGVEVDAGTYAAAEAAIADHVSEVEAKARLDKQTADQERADAQRALVHQLVKVGIDPKVLSTALGVELPS